MQRQQYLLSTFHSGDSRRMKTDNKRQQQRYDHRLRELVRHTGDPDSVAHLGVPRSTAISWLKDDRSDDG